MVPPEPTHPAWSGQRRSCAVCHVHFVIADHEIFEDDRQYHPTHSGCEFERDDQFASNLRRLRVLREQDGETVLQAFVTFVTWVMEGDTTSSPFLDCHRHCSHAIGSLAGRIALYTNDVWYSLRRLFPTLHQIFNATPDQFDHITKVVGDAFKLIDEVCSNHNDANWLELRGARILEALIRTEFVCRLIDADEYDHMNRYFLPYEWKDLARSTLAKETHLLCALGRIQLAVNRSRSSSTPKTAEIARLLAKCREIVTRRFGDKIEQIAALDAISASQVAFCKFLIAQPPQNDMAWADECAAQHKRMLETATRLKAQANEKHRAHKALLRELRAKRCKMSAAFRNARRRADLDDQGSSEPLTDQHKLVAELERSLEDLVKYQKSLMEFWEDQEEWLLAFGDRHLVPGQAIDPEHMCSELAEWASARNSFSSGLPRIPTSLGTPPEPPDICCGELTVDYADTPLSLVSPHVDGLIRGSRTAGTLLKAFAKELLRVPYDKVVRAATNGVRGASAAVSSGCDGLRTYFVGCATTAGRAVDFWSSLTSARGKPMAVPRVLAGALRDTVQASCTQIAVWTNVSVLCSVFSTQLSELLLQHELLPTPALAKRRAGSSTPDSLVAKMILMTEGASRGTHPLVIELEAALEDATRIFRKQADAATGVEDWLRKHARLTLTPQATL